MPIPESQLSTWSKRGADAAAQNTHQSIRTALNGGWQLQNKSFDPFLQGSYRNATNIRADSDVDLVVKLNDVWVADTTALVPDQLALYRSWASDATYGWDEFRTGVLEALCSYYGADKACAGNKAIKIAPDSNRLAADVVVAIEYRRYHQFRGVADQRYDEGIWFQDGSGRAVVNYPKQHYDNGAAKNAAERTGEQFKPAVRMFKNARGRLIERGVIAKDLAPSYFLQGLLYNVPDGCFELSLQDTYVNVVNWLNSHRTQFRGFVCQNGIVPLFGDAAEQWDEDRANTLVSALIDLWNGWK